MAQPHSIVEYIGSIRVRANQLVNSATIMSIFPDANMMKMKTKGVDLKVSVNNCDMFDIDYNDESHIRTGHTYIFDKDCIIAIGKYVNIT